MARALLVAVGVVVAACAGDDGPPGRAEAPIRNGMVGGEPALVAVGLRPVRCEERLIATCTGTLIDERLVLTAGHCVEAGSDYAIHLGAETATGGRVIDVVEVVRHPTFDAETLQDDLALLRLAVAAPLDGTPFVPAQAPLAAGDVGVAVSISGYGTDGTGGEAGLLRQGTSTITELQPTTFRTAPGPSMSCSGDSGGPLWRERSGYMELVGVTSRGDAACEDHAVNVDVGAYAAWLTETAAELGGAPDPAPVVDWASCQACVSDDECGYAALCEINEEGLGRCALAPLPAGALAASCASDDECATGTCARTPAAGPSGACACLEPCASTVEGCGCRVAGGGREPGGQLLAALIVLVGLASSIIGRRRHVGPND